MKPKAIVKLYHKGKDRLANKCINDHGTCPRTTKTAIAARKLFPQPDIDRPPLRTYTDTPNQFTPTASDCFKSLFAKAGGTQCSMGFYGWSDNLLFHIRDYLTTIHTLSSSNNLFASMLPSVAD